MKHFAIALMLLLSACVSAQAIADRQNAATPEHFRATVTTKDDSLDTVAEINTSQGYATLASYGVPTTESAYLRALIDKATGSTTFEVYDSISFRGSSKSRMSFRAANYATPDQPLSTPTDLLSRDIDCANSKLLGYCTHTDHLVFRVEEWVLRALVKANPPEARWPFKFMTKSGGESYDSMPCAEISGLLMAVDDYRHSHKLGLYPGQS